jgi:hypothetical protein
MNCLVQKNKKIKMEIAIALIKKNKDGYLLLCHLGLTSLPELPDHIVCLWCNGNRLKELPNLPPRLFQLRCDQNQLTKLPDLPHNLRTLRCDQNNLTSLPPLPESLRSLWCNDNKIASLPILPTYIVDLWCDGNELIKRFPKESPKQYEGRIRVMKYKEELMMNRWHPSRVEKLLEQGFDIEDI